jgi:hypothetical protein
MEQKVFLTAHEDKIRYAASACLRNHKDAIPSAAVGEMSLYLSSAISSNERDRTVTLLGDFLCYSFLLTDPGFLLSEKEARQLEKKMSYWLLELDDYFVNEIQQSVETDRGLAPETLRIIAGETERQAEAIQNYLLTDLKAEGNLKEIFKSRFSQAQRLCINSWSKILSERNHNKKSKLWWWEFLYYLILFLTLFCFAIYANSK